MSAKIIDGKEISKEIIDDLQHNVTELKNKGLPVPGLVTILVGNHPASLSYVTLKIKTAKKIGFHEVQRNLEDTISESELIAIIEEYNNDPKIHGILVQLPLPDHINQEKVMYSISPGKDVDGFHPYNLGNMFIHFQPEQLVPCTPAGVMEMLRRTCTTEGANIVVVGRSNLVGKPLSVMLMQAGFGGNATVTTVHSRTKDISSFTREADILVVAIGKAEFIRGKDVKKGAVVIDVGVNRVGEVTNQAGKKVAILKGDVAYEEVLEVASAITPVPGGVGPMTIAYLMKNTLQAYHNLSSSA